MYALSVPLDNVQQKVTELMYVLTGHLVLQEYFTIRQLNSFTSWETQCWLSKFKHVQEQPDKVVQLI